MPIRKCHNLCSKCPPSADTQQRRRLRHSSIVALQTTLQPIAASAFAVVYLPKADTSNTSYDTYVDIVNLNGLFSLYVFIINIVAAVNGTDSHVQA